MANGAILASIACFF